LAEQEGAATLEKLRKGENVQLTWSAPKMVSRRDAQNVPAELVRRVLAADASKLPAYVGTPIQDAGYLLVRITKVVEGKPTGDEKQSEARTASMLGVADYESFVASLKGKADITVNAANLEKK